MGTQWSQHEASQSQPNHGEHKNSREANPSSSTGSDEAKPSGNGKKAKEQMERAVKSIHNLDAITANADFPLDSLSPENLMAQLRQGILLNQKRQKYWVDKMGKNCFMVYARDLLITWAEDERYWIWYPTNGGSDDESIEVAELLNVCWLEVCGKFDAKNLSPETSYEVSIVAMVKQRAYGWDDVPVNVTLNLADGSKSERRVDMMSVQPREQWVEIPAGMFRTSPQNQPGEISFCLYEYHGGNWKSGLVIKGVKIQPP